MANIIIGMNGAIGPVFSTPNTLLNQPHSNTATTTPYAAPIDSRFMITAFSGTRRLRNTAIKSRKLSRSTAPMNTGSRDDSCCDTSTLDAVRPPTCTCTSVPPTADGITRLRSVSTRSVVLTDCGELAGITRITAASPAGFTVGGVTAAMSGVARSLVTRMSRGAVSDPFGNSAARINGPLNPSPKPSATRS